jgi:hypothetical protein
MPLLVNSMSTCRRSVGCGRRRTSPLSSSDRTVPVIDCGRTRSVAARSFVLSGPLRRRWLITASCETEGPDSTRIRLVPRDKVSRSSNASAATESRPLAIFDSSIPREVLTFDMQHRHRRQWQPNVHSGDTQATRVGSSRYGKLIAHLRVSAWSIKFGGQRRRSVHLLGGVDA